MDSLRGQLLVASPSLLDPNFLRTVVLVAEHGDEGAMGVVLNRPADIEVAEAAPVLSGLVEPGELVHSGGPVQATSVVILAEFADPAQAAAIVFGEVGFVGGDPDLEALGSAVRRARVFAGLAGWGPGQLESELEREDWILEPAQTGDVFAEDAAALWPSVLERKGGSFALISRMPLDPSLN